MEIMKILGGNYTLLLIAAIMVILFSAMDTSVEGAPDKRCGPGKLWDRSGYCMPYLIIPSVPVATWKAVDADDDQQQEVHKTVDTTGLKKLDKETDKELFPQGHPKVMPVNTASPTDVDNIKSGPGR